MEINQVYNEPCLETLKKMPNDFIDCVITSPPYWQLRDYGYDGQWGLEPTYQEYLENLWSMMDDIWRVLKPSGSVWINLGDTYSGSGAGHKETGKGSYSAENFRKQTTKVKNIQNKCLLLIPHRFAIGCIERGWILRNDIIWAKRNGMPESVTDRFSKKHEFIFFMTKNEKYYFDLDSVRDKVKTETLKRDMYDRNGNKGGADRDMIGYPQRKGQKNIDKYGDIFNETKHRQGMNKDRGNNIIEKRPYLPTQKEFVEFIRNRVDINVLVNSVDIPRTKIEHWFRKDEIGFSYPSVNDWNIIKEFLDNWDDEFETMDKKMTHIEYETDDIKKNADRGKNCGDVSDFWDIPTKPSSSSHYATYNDELLKKPAIAGCPEGGLIYDPFMGTGTTAMVAIRSNRNFIGSEMSADYMKIYNNNVKPHLNQLNLF
jgi:DNA modification methylase